MFIFFVLFLFFSHHSFSISMTNVMLLAGYYMYLEGDDVTQGDSARLLSQSCQFDGPICFHFWYYMLGSATSMVLDVYQLQGNKATKVWGIIDNKGSEWQLGKADLKISGPFKVRFFFSYASKMLILLSWKEL